jgi:hypothetical protein
MNCLRGRMSRAQVGKRLFPGGGHASPGLEPLACSGWRKGPQEQPQASLFSMAFYSYVILLLTHIGIGAVAHGEDSQRGAPILSKRASGEPGQWRLLLPTQAASEEKEVIPLLLSSLLTSFPTTSCDRRDCWTLSLWPQCWKAGIRPELCPCEGLGMFSLGKWGWNKKTRSSVLWPGAAPQSTEG